MMEENCTDFDEEFFEEMKKAGISVTVTHSDEEFLKTMREEYLGKEVEVENENFE